MSSLLYMIVVAIALLLRTMVGLWGHSGQGVPPMFGDFEAQRHWLEITSSLPVGDWYKHTQDNDLQYWGLDYPPLTAYVSLFFGKIASRVSPGLVALHSSRGFESVEGKVFMRGSVIIMDILVLFPIMYLLCRHLVKPMKSTSLSLFSFMLSVFLMPGLLIIDHGHFQYNGVCLGLALTAAYLILKGHDILGSVFFCLSLNFKQMSLYYAPVFFFCLLRKCFEKTSVVAQLLGIVKLGVTVVTVFALLWSPFCLYPNPEDSCVSSLLQVLHRQFPFARGIFEDKVANLWYSVSVLVDIRQYLTQRQLVTASLGLTLLLLSPTCVNLLANKLSTKRMLLALMNSSLAFFLASYQVHEKSVLLPLFPALFLLPFDPSFVSWFQIVGTFTMFPLLKKDQLQIPYVACNVIFLCLASLYAESREVPTPGVVSCSRIMQLIHSEKLKKLVIGISCTGMLILHAMELFVTPPTKYPDLYPALFSIYGCANLTFIYLVGLYWMFSCEDSVVKQKKML